MLTKSISSVSFQGDSKGVKRSKSMSDLDSLKENNSNKAELESDQFELISNNNTNPNQLKIELKDSKDVALFMMLSQMSQKIDLLLHKQFENELGENEIYKSKHSLPDGMYA